MGHRQTNEGVRWTSASPLEVQESSLHERWSFWLESNLLFSFRGDTKGFSIVLIPTPDGHDDGGDSVVEPANIYASDTQLNTSQIILILTITLWNTYYYYSHFTDEEVVRRSLRKMKGLTPWIKWWLKRKSQACVVGFQKALLTTTRPPSILRLVVTLGALGMLEEAADWKPWNWLPGGSEANTHQDLSQLVWTPCAGLWILLSFPHTFSLRSSSLPLMATEWLCPTELNCSDTSTSQEHK